MLHSDRFNVLLIEGDAMLQNNLLRFVVVTLFISHVSVTSAVETTRPPNVVLILVDDLGWMDGFVVPGQ